MTVRKESGFSLIELLIVVAIILIIAGIAIPNLLRSRMAAHESSAAANMHTLNVAQSTYSTTYPLNGYANSLGALGQGGTACLPTDLGPTSACLIDNVLGCPAQPCTVDGYVYNINNSAPTVSSVGINNYGDYTAGALPQTINSGTKDFCTYDDNVVRSKPFVAGDTQPTLAVCKTSPYLPI